MKGAGVKGQDTARKGPRTNGPLLPAQRTGPFSIFFAHLRDARIVFLPFFLRCHAAFESSVPRPETEPRPSVVEVWSPNHWTAGNFQKKILN